MNDPKHKEEALLAAIAGAERELSEAVAVGRKFNSDARDELAKLEAELPAAMLAHVKGGDGTRRLEIRSRIRELKADLAELPFLDQGFERERAQIQATKNLERMAREKRKSYERLKESLLEDPRLIGIATIDDIRSLAKALDCEQDATSFLESLKGATAA